MEDVMVLTKDEAAAALADIQATTRRGATLRGYRIGGPILMLWSVIWMLGYLSMGLLPSHQWGWVWLVLDTVGAIGSILLARPAEKAARVAGAKSDRSSLKMMGGMAVAIVFVMSTFYVLRPTDPAAYLAFPGLMVGAIYAAVGVFVAGRYLGIGAVMFALTLVGFYAFPEILAFWMASASVALFVSGVWLARA
ncbi:hypothetical protein G5B46_20595 [Caulobacter sp. 602-2]|uniref:Uncharacterized protein n=2 Tax=Caulobacter sp. 602-2 TaxID=2710887 RepID=A0A6G4R2R8_9CAUL|nr:hypothetical protein [Caulobacter sp. 602-2]